MTKLSVCIGDLVAWHGQGRNRIDTLASGAQRFPAGGEDSQVRRAMQHRLGDARDRPYKMLAIIEHQQQTPRPQAAGDVFRPQRRRQLR